MILTWRTLTYYMNLLLGGFISPKVIKDTDPIKKLIWDPTELRWLPEKDIWGQKFGSPSHGHTLQECPDSSDFLLPPWRSVRGLRANRPLVILMFFRMCLRSFFHRSASIPTLSESAMNFYNSGLIMLIKITRRPSAVINIPFLLREKYVIVNTRNQKQRINFQ